jgi:hypothetical protein
MPEPANTRQNTHTWSVWRTTLRTLSRQDDRSGVSSPLSANSTVARAE